MTTRIQTFDGNIGIGTNDPGSYKLRVEGSVKANSLEINGVTNAQVPIGLIAIWSGLVSEIPAGWALCDGRTVVRSDNDQNILTPNLAGRFVRGATADSPESVAPGYEGGSNAYQIGVENLPIHNHSFTTDGANACHAHSVGHGNAPHGHTVSSNRAPHSHYANARNAPHSHPVLGLGFRYGTRYYPGQPYQYIFTFSGTTTGNANAPHGHPVNTANACHAHPLSNANACHTHPLGSNNANHAHTGTTSDNPAHLGTALTVTNPFYVLAYIMKH